MKMREKLLNGRLVQFCSVQKLLPAHSACVFIRPRHGAAGDAGCDFGIV